MKELLVEIQNLSQIIIDNEDKCNDLKLHFQSLFTFKDFVPKININLNSHSVIIEYTNVFDKLHRFSFEIQSTQKELKIKPVFILQNYESNEINVNKEIHFDTIKKLTDISEFVFMLNQKETLLLLVKLRKIINCIKSSQKKRSELTFKVDKINASKEFHTINLTLPKIGDFCIDSYLCKKHQITFTEKPTKKEIESLKRSIIAQKRDVDTYFLIYTQDEKDIIKVSNICLRENFIDGSYHLICPRKVKSKKSINKLLSCQFTFEDQLFNTNDIFSNSLFEIASIYKYSHRHWDKCTDSVYNVEYDFTKLTSLLTPIALRKTIANF